MEDPRRINRGNHHHLLSDILLLSVSAILCGSNDWALVKTFGDNQLEWLKKYGSFEKGIPSCETLERVFSALKPESFSRCFINWIEDIRKKTTHEVIAIDGKCIRGADPKTDKKGMPHIVSAFASENDLCLGQIKVSEKSNEITAIPLLLDLISIEDSIITIDAMGCQTDISDKIIDNNADYILAVKGNQGILEQNILETSLLENPACCFVDDDAGHGRVERRTCTVYDTLSHVENLDKWIGLKTLVIIESEVYNKKTGKTTKDKRLYISSLRPDAELINRSIRNHWSVENNLHWVLDVTFKEDASRKRTGHQAENFNILLKIVMGLLSNEKTKISKPRKRLTAALDSTYREKILGL